MFQGGAGFQPNWNWKPEPSELFFQEPLAEPELSEQVLRNRTRNRSGALLLNNRETQRKPLSGGSVRTENQNCSNGPVHEP